MSTIVTKNDLTMKDVFLLPCRGDIFNSSSRCGSSVSWMLTVDTGKFAWGPVHRRVVEGNAFWPVQLTSYIQSLMQQTLRELTGYQPFSSVLCQQHNCVLPHCRGARWPIWSLCWSIQSSNKCLVLHSDASGAGLGAVLEQVSDDGQLHPIVYESWMSWKHEWNYR